MNIKLTDAIVFPSDLGEASLKIIGVTAEDDGIYTCIAANDMGSVSSSASLRVLGRPVSLLFFIQLYSKCLVPIVQEKENPSFGHPSVKGVL